MKYILTGLLIIVIAVVVIGGVVLGVSVLPPHVISITLFTLLILWIAFIIGKIWHNV